MNNTIAALRARLLPFLIATSLVTAVAIGDEINSASNKTDSAHAEDRLLSNIRQLIFEGRRSGEGYFSADGRQMVFQSEREPGNPFYQIYLMDLETGDTKRISTGTGKTTCAWIHPSGERVLFASTHQDPAARDKQQEELDKRASGQGSRYSWSFDPSYEIFEADTDGNLLRRLTDAEGYDAEGSWSPDGARIVFASNRHIYLGERSAAEQAVLEQDPSRFMELYIMDADGGNVERLTEHDGYDGGPFFSADGERIVWRRFEANGKVAEIWTMNADGSDQRQITDLGVMSWAPFFHPSGDYIIFANNAQGYANFELYLVDAEGRSQPVRVTDSAGFDGLPVFTPDGERLAWASGRTANKQPQIFIADWNDAAARELLGLPLADSDPDRDVSTGEAGIHLDDPIEDAGPVPEVPATEPAISADDLRLHVEILASEALAGRRTGTAGERIATDYVAKVMAGIGLQPGAPDGGWLQPYDFASAVALGDDNRLILNGLESTDGERPGGGLEESLSAALDRDWRPLAFSGSGETGPSPVVFAGYGIVAPGNGEQSAYDSYRDLDVDGKWVLVLRYLPEDVAPERRQYLNEYASLRFKAMVAREQGAAGLLIASGPTSGVQEELVSLSKEAGAGGGSLPVISISDALADRLLSSASTNLEAKQRALDSGEPSPGMQLPGVELSARIDLEPVRAQGRNVLGRLVVGGQPSETVLMIGAHVDHIGLGEGLDSRDGETGVVHPGADDNASGVAALLEIAEQLADRQQRGELDLEHDLLFAAWSGEELGRLGSAAFIERLGDQISRVIAYLNLDMVGRLDEALYVQGVGSSPVWRRELERRNAPVGLPLRLQDDAYLPTDTTSFYLAGVPILNFFTGVHADYNTARDTADRIAYEGLARIARLTGLIATAVASTVEAPAYVAQEKPSTNASRANLRAYLGTIPAYTDSDLNGVLLDGVAENGPADNGGLRAGDRILAIAGQRVENIYDYTYALNALKVGEQVAVRIERNGSEQELSVVPAPRE